MTLAYRTDEGHPLIAALVPASGRYARLSLDVDARDEMLLHYCNLHGGDREKALVLYFDSGRRIWETMRAVLRWRFGAPGPRLQLLDFASGYGRVTRFAVLDVPPEPLGGGRLRRRRAFSGGALRSARPRLARRS